MTTTTRTLPPGLRLSSGGHKPPNGEFEACVMEAVAYVAGEPWTDHPECACPVLSGFLRRWNDTLGDEDRQMLVPLIPRLVGTRSAPEVEARRVWMLTDWLAREFAPGWLRLAGLTAQAETLEGLASLVDTQTARDAQPTLDQVRKDSAAARDAAGAAAWDAAGAAAWAAAWDAAGAAAWAAAWDAAGAAAWDAARDAARAAAWDAAGAAAWDAAGAAARAALAPTTKALQQSALALLDRMIEVKQ